MESPVRKTTPLLAKLVRPELLEEPKSTLPPAPAPEREEADPAKIELPELEVRLPEPLEAGAGSRLLPKPAKKVVTRRSNGVQKAVFAGRRIGHLSVLLKEDERADLDALAFGSGLTASSYVRERILQDIKKQRERIDEVRRNLVSMGLLKPA